MLPIACQTAEPNGAEIFCGHSCVAGGCFRLKKKISLLLNFFSFHGQRRARQLVSTKNKKCKKKRFSFLYQVGL